MSAQAKPGTFPFQVAALNARQAGQAAKTQSMIIKSEVERHLDRIIFWRVSSEFWKLAASHWNLAKNPNEEAKAVRLQHQAVEMVERARFELITYVQQETFAAYYEGYRDSGNMQAENESRVEHGVVVVHCAKPK